MTDTLCCGTCDQHAYYDGTTLKLDNGDTISGLKKAVSHTHYCTVTASGLKKIKHAADWTGMECPKWCPKIAEEGEKASADSEQTDGTPEYREFRCCMCPNTKTENPICPGKPGTLHPNDSPCRFIKRYEDSRGWLYFVRAGLGGNTYKTFYKKPEKRNTPDTLDAHGWRSAEWRDSFDEAQADLNKAAKIRGWKEAK